MPLFRKMHNQLTIKEYIEEFYKVNLREEYVEDNPERVAKYINGSRFEIQDEMFLLSASCIRGILVFLEG